MKAITVLQPRASLIACGAKQIETRSWAARYRGKIAIHAGKGTENIDLCKQQIFWTNLWTYEIAVEYTWQQRAYKDCGNGRDKKKPASNAGGQVSWR